MTRPRCVVLSNSFFQFCSHSRCDLLCPGDSLYSCGEGIYGAIYQVGANYKQPVRLTDKSGWVATASSIAGGAPGLLLDDDTATTFTTSGLCCYTWVQVIFKKNNLTKKLSDEISPFLQIDLGQSKLVSGMKLDIISIYPEMATNLEVVFHKKSKMNFLPVINYLLLFR